MGASGLSFGDYDDIVLTEDANETCAEYVREWMRATVQDPMSSTPSVPPVSVP